MSIIMQYFLCAGFGMHNAPRSAISFYCKYDLLIHMLIQEAATVGLYLTSNQKVHSSFISGVICRQDQRGLIQVL